VPCYEPKGHEIIDKGPILPNGIWFSKGTKFYLTSTP